MEQGNIDALAFTSRPQVPNLLTIAAEAGKEDSLRYCLSGPVAVASVGPVCTRKLEECGITVDVEPETSSHGQPGAGRGRLFQRRQLVFRANFAALVLKLLAHRLNMSRATALVCCPWA